MLFHVHKDMQDQLKGQTSYTHKQNKIYSALWKLVITPIVKIFLLRACLEGLPTNNNLFKRKMLENPNCPICIQMEETIIHALWLCPIPQDIYYQYFKKIQKSSLSTMTFLKLLEEMSTIL